MINPWNKIFELDFDTAYKIADENYRLSQSEFDLRARTKSCLLLRKYTDALADFLLIKEMEKESGYISDGAFMDIGLCYYALGDFENAVEYFKYPVVNKQIKYRTSDVSVLPSVLLFIGVKLEKPDIVKMAIKELKRLSKFKTAAPNYLLGEFSELQLDRLFQDEQNETLRNRKQCKAEFYKAIHCLQLGVLEGYKTHMINCFELTGKYLEFEYYMAQVECEIYLQ